MPAISIIVPVYKVEPYLHRCIDSILAQSFTDFELILVDDGSPDNCPAICDEYAVKDSRVRVIHQKNAGLSAARNAGIETATGGYLCFIDSDDVLSPAYCQLLYQAVADGAYKISACKMERFTADDFSVEKNTSVSSETFHVSYDVFLKKQMGREIEIGVCSKLFHRSLFRKIRFTPGKLHEDIFFAADLLSTSECDVAYLNIPLYFYRQRNESIMNQQVNAAKCSPDRIEAGEYLIECAKKVNYPYLNECLFYAIDYPWYFIDPIYVRRRFKENRLFLDKTRDLIRKNRQLYQELPQLSEFRRKRMMLFSRSKWLYGLNAYARLFRVYLFRILNLDAYADGHGI